MTNNKVLLVVFGVVIAVAGVAIYFLMNPTLPGPSAIPVPPVEDTLKKTFIPVKIEPTNEHVKGLNDRIVALEAAEWSKTNFERLES
ncbi:MAG: hypothetical protein AAF597_09215, partial [Bacteroidota bacterium]